MPRPRTVLVGIGGFLAHALLGLLGSILTFTALDDAVDDAARRADVDPDDIRGIVLTFALVGLGFIATYLVVLWFAWRGRHGARVVLWVLGGLGLVSGSVGLAGAGAAGTVLGLLELGLLAVGITALALTPSNDWYRAEGRRRQSSPD